MSTRHLVLVRHGQSTWNVERRVQGQLGDGLSPLGREQARLTATAVAAMHPGAILVASDLLRCTQTVAPFETALGRRAILDPGLRERDFGDWSGRLLPEIADGWPRIAARWREGEDVVAEVGGESSPALATRVATTLRRLLREHAVADDLVCVTHGGPVWYGLHALLDLPNGSLGPVGNASVTRLEVHEDGRIVLGSWNEQGHLPADQRSSLQPTGLSQRAAAPPVGR